MVVCLHNTMEELMDEDVNPDFCCLTVAEAFGQRVTRQSGHRYTKEEKTVFFVKLVQVI